MLGREEEAERLHRLPAAVIDGGRDGSGAPVRILVHGEAGIGKTALLDEAVARWLDADEPVMVLRVNGHEAETGVAFLGVSDLLRPLRSIVDALTAEHAAALRGVAGAQDALGLDAFAIGRALTELLARAALDRAILVVIDDIQWLDEASTQAILFAARRLSAEPVGFVFTRRDFTRPTETEVEPPPRGFVPMALAGVDEEAAAALLREASPVPVAVDVVDKIVAAAGGNPLALTEAPRVLSTEQLSGIRPLPEPIPVGHAILDGFAARVAHLGARTRQALTVLAVAGTDDAALVDRALTSLGLTMADLDPAGAAGVIRHDHGRIAFRHPLLRSTASSAASPADRRVAHLAVVAALDLGDERRAWHLAEAAVGPDDEVAAELDELGRRSARLGDHSASSSALERAARLSRRRDQAADRFLRAALAAWRAGNLRRAEALLADVHRASLDPGAVADHERLTARIAATGGQLARAIDHFRAAAAASSHPTSAALALIEASRWSMRQSPTAEDARALASEARQQASQADAPTQLAAEVAELAARLLGGETDLLQELRDRAILLLSDGDDLDETGPLVTEVAWIFFSVQEWTEALDLLEPLEAWARRRRNLQVLPTTLAIASEVHIGRGAYGLARQAADEANGLAEAVGDEHVRIRTEFVLGRLAIYDDDSPGVPPFLQALIDGGGEMELRARAFVGRRHLWAGQYDEANEHFARMVEVFDQFGWPASPAHLWEFDRVEALQHAGRDQDARRAMAEFEARVADSPSPTVERMLRKCRGLIATTPDAVESHIRAALAIPKSTPYQRSSIHLGAARRLAALGAIDAAIPHYDAALQEVERTGARAPTSAIRAELESLGLPIPAPSKADTGLSPSEQRVLAELVAGASTSEVADRLAIPRPTVERLLRSIEEKHPTESVRPMDADDPDRVVIETLGRFSVTRGGRPVTLAPATAAALKAVIAARGSIRSELLIDHFWPDADVETGRARLRTALARVRRGAGDVLVRRNAMIELAPGTVVDAFEFEDEADRLVHDGSATLADFRRASARYAGPFLPADVFEPWATAMRTRIDRRYLALLERGAVLAIGAGDLTLAEELLDRVAALEPHDEDRLVAAASLLLDAGRRSAALRFARAARRAVEELGMPPSAALLRLEQGAASST